MARIRGKNGRSGKGTEAGGPGKSAPSSSASSLLKLQKSAGNSAVSRLLKSGLAVGAPGDAHEQEAERMADQAISPTPTSEELPSQESQAAGTQSPLPGLGPGRPLDPEARALLEPRFGRDFGAVRVHDDPAAAEAAREVDARAFTVGKDLVFAPGQYAPETTAGQRLLAHELTHVVQQSSSGSPPLLQRSPWDVKMPSAAPSESPASQAGPWTPLATVEIGVAEPVSSDDSRLVEFAKTAQGSLQLFPGAQINITGFWEQGDAGGKGGVDRAVARQRAELAKAALAKLGIAPQRMVTSTLASHVLGDPKTSPGGLVRIALFPSGAQQPAALPNLNLPPISSPPNPKTQPSTSPGSQASPATKPPGILDQDTAPRKGEAGDVAKAVLELPAVKKAVEEAKEQALATWKDLPLGGKIGLIAGTIAIGTGAALGLASKPELGKEVLKKIHGVEVPIPQSLIPGKFSIKILTDSELPKFDPHQPPSPQKLADPAGPGFILKWELKF